MRLAGLALLSAIFWMNSPSAVPAQSTRLSITGHTIALPTPTAADFAAGYIVAGNLTTYTVDARNGTTGQRTATVSIRCASSCPTNGPKARASLKWRRADLAAWNTISTTNVPVETRAMFRNGSNDPWSNQIVWRFDLDWINDPPGNLTRFNIVYTLTVTVP